VSHPCSLGIGKLNSRKRAGVILEEEVGCRCLQACKDPEHCAPDTRGSKKHISDGRFRDFNFVADAVNNAGSVH